MSENVHPFAKFAATAWPHRFAVELEVADLHGGVPKNPDVVRSWLRAKAGYTSDLELEAEVSRIFAVDPTRSDSDVADEAVKPLADRHLNGFKRDDNGLYVEGRQVKAAIKEATSVARAAGKLTKTYGTTSKGVTAFVAEHVCVVEDRLYLGRQEPDQLHTRFVSTWRGSGITVEEVCHDVKLAFTVITDHPFSAQEWAMIWLTGEQQGLGASRSQGFGRYTITAWTPEQ
jgi:hypothetical protein